MFTPLRFAIALLVVAAVTALPTRAVAAEVSFPKRDVPDFGVMNNDDGDWLFRAGPDPETARRGMLRAVDELAGTSIRTHVQCVGLGSDVLYYPTKVASVVGWGPLKKPNAHVERVMAGMTAGIDPIRVVGERVKQNGLRFIPSYRLNDAHFAREPEGHYATGKFWVDNHSKFALPNNRLDFSHAEVRAFRGAIIDEVIDRYADVMDGIELDFTRHGLFFPADQARAKAPLITEMVTHVRQRFEVLERERGRPYYVVVRVWATLEDCAKSGIDVEAWISRRLVDVVVPAQLYSTSFDMPIEPLTRLSKAVGVKVYPCLYERTVYGWPMVRSPRVDAYASAPTFRPSPAMIAGAVSTYRHLGADGFELYNFRIPLGTLGLATQRIASAPSALNGHDRVYVLTPSEGSATRLPTFQGRPNLPAKLLHNKPLKWPLLIGSDFTDPDVAPPATIALRIGFDSVLNVNTPLRVKLNGMVLHDGPVGSKAIVPTWQGTSIAGFGTPPRQYFQVDVSSFERLRAGANDIEVELLKPDGEPSVVDVQLGLFYNDPFSTRI